MKTADQNFRLLQEIEANRRFLLMAYEQNPGLLASAEPRIRQLFERESLASGVTGLNASAKYQRGISLIELIMFIVIVSVALAGILLVMNVTTRSSADPLVHKQALAIAESLLEEVELMPFTFCDPNDANAEVAAAAVGACAVAANEESAVIGPEAGETRYHATTPFDNVSDFHGFAMNGGAIFDITDGTTKISGLDGFSLAPIVVAPIDFGGITAASGDALQITVTVAGPDGVPVTVDGVRTRYAPRALP